MPRVEQLSTDLWGFGRDNGKGFPLGFVKRVRLELYRGGPFLHLCCGPAHIEDAVNVDLAPDPAIDVQADALALPFRDAAFGFVLADPPYPEYDSQRLYHTPQLPLYSLLEEMSRVTAPNGYYALLYPFYPTTLGCDELCRVIVTTHGPHRRPRILSVFHRGMFPGTRARQYGPRQGL